MIRNMIVALLLALLVGCSLAPEQPVTRLELMKTDIYGIYIIEESPEELLYALNTRGEVVVESKRNIPGKEFNIYLKLLATADGIEVLEYDR
jgi:uncharacterized protein YcfL